MNATRQTLALTIGQRLRLARRQGAWTQADAAERAGIAPEVYGRLERGRMVPRSDTLASLAQGLGVSSDALLGLSPPREADGRDPLRLTTEDLQVLGRPEVRRLARQLCALPTEILKMMGVLLAALERRAAGRTVARRRSRQAS